MEINFLALLAAAFSTLVVGFIWYNPKVFGNIWMRESGLSAEDLKGSNMVTTLVMSLIYAFLIAFILQFLVIHQTGVMGLIEANPDKAKPSYHAFINDYGQVFRTFKHGALHGFMSGLLFALPVVGTSALYERRSWKYTLISGGFWVVCCMIMGGIICAWQ